jgi:hypothetical protein
MPDAIRIALQGFAYAAFAAFIGYFSVAPAYQPLDPGQALIRLSFSQPGKLLADCRSRTAEELAKLPPTMRTAQECPRERSPIRVEIELDGGRLLQQAFPPTGLRQDGASSAYRRLQVPAGDHELRVRLSDDARAPGFTHERTARLQLTAGQIVLIDFVAERGGIVIR